MEYHGTAGNDTIDQATLLLPDGSDIYGEAGDDIITLKNGKAIGGAGNNTITGTSADAVAVYWASPAGVTVNLATGLVSNGYGGTDHLSGIRNVFGSSANDTFIGDRQDNGFVGMGGSDTFSGGGGYDTVSYFFTKSSEADISYDAATDTFTVKKHFANGERGTDILRGIDAIVFQGDGSDNTQVYRGDFTSKVSYSLAGVWQPLGAEDARTASIVPPFYGQLALGPNQLSGLVLASWAFKNGGFGGSGNPFPVNLALLEQQSDGTMKLATEKYLPQAHTGGTGSVNIADFNQDGKPDIFLAAHNESPFQAVGSVAYLSNGAGTFDRVDVGDAVMAHDATVAYVNGVPTIFTRSFEPGDYNPSYQYVNGKFVETQETTAARVIGMSIAVADFDNNGSYEAMVGDLIAGPGYAYSPEQKWVTGLYALSDMQAGTGQPLAIIPGYLSTHPAYQDFVSFGGKGWTHSSRLWTDDFNHDGLLDVLVQQSMWSSSSTNYPSVLQMLQNKGSLQFEDRTNTLNPDVDLLIEEFDYSLQRIDLDHSGIASYISGGRGSVGADGHVRASNYLLVNDGTGRLHVALHEQFTELAQGAHDFLFRSAEARAAGYQSSMGPISMVGKFIAYQLADGALNFVMQDDSGMLVNVPLHYNVSTDFLEAIRIEDRNSSKLMRTFAGNDTIFDQGVNGSAHIDGGLGIDTAVYSGAAASYRLQHLQQGGWTLASKASAATSVDDTLVNIERLQFKDMSVGIFDGKAGDYRLTADSATPVQPGAPAVAIQGLQRLYFSDVAIGKDADGHGGQAYRVYQAAFDRKPDAAGLGYWIAAMDDGASLRTVAQNFLGSAEFQALYGATPSNATLVEGLYRNVLHRTPDAGGTAYWLDILAQGLATRADVLASFSESAENRDALAAVIGAGFEFLPFS